MTRDIVIQDFTKGDIEKLLPLMNAEFAIKKNYDYIIWQFFENPLEHKIKVAVINDRIIGWFGIQKRILDNGIKCGQLSYLFIAPDWRGRGIFKRLGLSVIESMSDLDLFFVFANTNARIPCEKSFDMQTISPITSYVCTSFQNITPSEFSYADVNESTIFKDANFGLSDRVSFCYSNEYFSWRFVHNRLYHYIKIELDSGEYVLVKIFKDPKSGYSIGDIVFYTCNFNDPSLVERLLLCACYFLKCSGVKAITTWAPNQDHVIRILSRIGFVNNGPSAYFTLRVINPDKKYLNDYSRWIIMQSDATNY